MPQNHVEPLLPSAPARPGQTRVVRIGSVVVGGPAVPVLAGPCSVEPDFVAHAVAVAAAGASVLRGCVHKPRTRPDAFQGLGAAGFALLDEARRSTGLPVLSEPMEPDDVAAVGAHCDALLVGARSMQNTPLLRAVGRSGMPVVLKRGLAATIDEWLGAADYILAEGNPDVILCERGIRTFETSTRNTLDVAAVAVLRERTDLPVIVDPSHAAGRAALVAPLALAALAAGADGLLVECHPVPAASWSDAAQALDPTGLRRLVDAVEAMSALVRPVAASGIGDLRDGIDAVDAALARLLDRRAELVARVQAGKRALGASPRDPEREAALVRRVMARAPRLGDAGAHAVVGAVVGACLDHATASRAAAASRPVAAVAGAAAGDLGAPATAGDLGATAAAVGADAVGGTAR